MLNPGKQSLGATSAEEPPPHDSLPDIAGRFQRVSKDVGADAFALFLVSPMAETRRLMPCIDTDFPGVSERTEFLAAALGDRFARRVTGTTQPCWWAEGSECLIVASLSRCLWAERIPATPGMGAALALPLTEERGQDGVVIMSGDSIALSMSALAETQARCLALFGLVAKSRPPAARTAPPVSRRELECLKLTANGQTSEEIAVRLGLSVHTANQYLTNSTQKLNAVNRMHAVAKALRLGLID